MMRILLLSLPLLTATPAPATASENGPSFASLVAAARRANLRVLEGRHLVLVTDRPERAGDGVVALPQVFDAAWSTWCEHYGLDAAQHVGWRAFGCLVVDRERFRAAGLLPAEIPEFANGFCHRDRFWLADQSNPDYRRHLLLHEGVHAFTLTLRGLDAPPWYTEGVAELLATHRIDADIGSDDTSTASAPRYVATPIPQRAADVEQLGRIEHIRGLRKSATCPGIDEVFATPGAHHRDLSAYASSWAAVAMLSGHPAHARIFAAAERGPLDAAFTTRLAATAGWDAARAARDFDAFTDELDYGYDFSRSAIDWSRGVPLADRRTVRVDGGRGWQNSGWSLEVGKRYTMAARGRCTIGRLSVPPPAAAVTLETEPAGISLRWYRGRPLGRLLAAQWLPAPPDGDRPRFVVVAEGSAGTFSAAADGALFFKLNESPGALADNEGWVSADIWPAF